MKFVDRKLERAVEAINALDANLKTAIEKEENRAVLNARLNPESGCHEIYLAQIPDLTIVLLDLSVSAGIVVHLLRSALDNLVYDLARKHTQHQIKKPKSVRFPIVALEENYTRSVTDFLSEISTDDQEIIREYQPFLGINGRPDNYSGPYIHQLTLLDILSIHDKHRDFVQITIDPNHFELSGAASPILDAWMNRTMTDPVRYTQGWKTPKMSVGAIVMEPVQSVSQIVDATFVGYALPSFHFAEGRPVIATLKRLCQFVQVIVAEFTDRPDLQHL